MDQDNESLIKAIRSQNEGSFVNLPLDVIKFDALLREIEKDNLTGMVEITLPQKSVNIFLKNGKILKCFINDREASIFEINDLIQEKGTISVYKVDEQVLNHMVLFAGAEPTEILSTEYADVKKYLKVKERDHFSGIVEFYEEKARGFLRLDNGEPQNGIFISEDGLSFFSDALSQIIDESRHFRVRSYDVTTLHPQDPVKQEILSHTTFTVYRRVDPRRLLTEFELFTPENTEEIRKYQLHPHQDRLYIIQNEKETIGSEFVYETREYNFVHWVLDTLFLELARTTVNSYRYLWYWIPECNTVEFLKQFDGHSFDIIFKTKNADILMQNPLGEILFTATFSDTITQNDLKKFIEEMKQFKTTRLEKGDLGAVFLVAHTFDKDALDLVEDIAQKSLADRLAKLKGFVRVSREAGFHLILVEGEPFKMVFPEVID